MTKPTFTPILCSRCGRNMGKKPGITVVTDAICNDPICNYQTEVTINEARDALIVAGWLGGVPVQQIAFASDVSRQRVYQIIDTWKAGV
jgi:hypothetical protein